jgi:transcriptional/translational regulatory protein YebC/TACO1
MIGNIILLPLQVSCLYIQSERHQTLPYIPNDLKDVTPEQRETIDKMIERLEEFDDVQTVYTNMKPEEVEE